VIVTTRRGGFAALGQVMDLDVIGLPDAVRLLRTRVPDLEEDTGEQIAQELGRLPQALEQAAAYLDRVQMPAGQYLDLLRARAATARRTAIGPLPSIGSPLEQPITHAAVLADLRSPPRSRRC
jgi:hypothetical protein